MKIYKEKLIQEKESFGSPLISGTYEGVAKQIAKENLELPTSPQIASLIYEMAKNPKKEFSELIKTLENRWIWEYTGNLYLPKSNNEINNGIILESLPKIKKEEIKMNRKSLIKRLQEEDPLVKFVPFGFKTGNQTWQELEKNEYLVARYGEEGAEKIASLVAQLPMKSFLWSVDLYKKIEKETARISLLKFSNYSFVINCFTKKGNDIGSTFRIKPEKETEKK